MSNCFDSNRDTERSHCALHEFMHSLDFTCPCLQTSSSKRRRADLGSICITSTSANSTAWRAAGRGAEALPQQILVQPAQKAQRSVAVRIKCNEVCSNKTTQAGEKVREICGPVSHSSILFCEYRGICRQRKAWARSWQLLKSADILLVVTSLCNGWQQRGVCEPWPLCKTEAWQKGKCVADHV